jgi:RimJ/RimL family protein N-acetyltransferase
MLTVSPADVNDRLSSGLESTALTSPMTLDKLQLETPRLLLRLPHADDLDAWAEMMADAEAAQFIGGVMARAVSWRALMTMIGAWHAHGFAMFSVVEKSTGRWVGRLGPWMPEGWPGTEVGWAIVRDCWGRGYATEGAAAAIDWAFDHLGWSRVIHCIDPANVASQGVARKLGSRKLGPGTLPPPFEDSPVDIWGQSREEWRLRRPSTSRHASR